MKTDIHLDTDHHKKEKKKIIKKKKTLTVSELTIQLVWFTNFSDDDNDSNKQNNDIKTVTTVTEIMIGWFSHFNRQGLLSNGLEDGPQQGWIKITTIIQIPEVVYEGILVHLFANVLCNCHHH